jgi:hypothetical protein
MSDRPIIFSRDHEMKRVGIEGFVESSSARRSFWMLWEYLHGPGAWDANPEVVVLTFTVERRNIDHG